MVMVTTCGALSVVTQARNLLTVGRNKFGSDPHQSGCLDVSPAHGQAPQQSLAQHGILFVRSSYITSAGREGGGGGGGCLKYPNFRRQ